MSSRPFAFRDLRAEPDAAVLERFHRDVLAPSFEPAELDPLDVIAEGLRATGPRRTSALVAVGPSGDVLGGVVGELYEPEQVLLLAYLAVRPDLRGRGIGTALLHRAAASWYGPGVALAVGEVHDPGRWPEEGDAAAGRLRLYAQVGARLLDVPFVQPALGPGRPRIDGFLLLAFHLAAEAGLGDGVPSGLLSRFVRAYYEREEGVRPPYDPELASLLELIEREPVVPLLPVDAYARVRAL